MRLIDFRFRLWHKGAQVDEPVKFLCGEECSEPYEAFYIGDSQISREKRDEYIIELTTEETDALEAFLYAL